MNLVKYNKLPRSFFERDSLIVSQHLLGKVLVKETKEGEIAGEITETEAYIGPYDKASHAYNNKKTKRTSVQFKERGCAYVFRIYGVYHCFCVVVGPLYLPAVALIRSVKPTKGIELIMRNRNLHKNIPIHRLTDGPSKVCQAFKITAGLNGLDLCSGGFFISEGNGSKFDIESSTRIGIDYAEEYRHVPWRFYIKDNKFVSKKKTSKLHECV